MTLTVEKLHELEYPYARQLPTGEWAAVRSMMYTWGLFIVVDEWCWRTRWCYEKQAEALAALNSWNGVGYPPGPWIKQKPEEVLNPAWARGDV